MPKRPTLFDPVNFGALALANRIVMPPMTRSRALTDGSPGPSTRLYYAQRASAGLVISEGIVVSPEGVGGPGIPGLWNATHVAGWKEVTDAVHAQAGTMVAQLWHTGRASHPSFQPDGKIPVGPSPVKISGLTFTEEGRVPYVVPRPLNLDEIQIIVGQFAEAAKNALKAGFDGVEIHAANGYLIDQFLQDSANLRTDRYGGSVQNRARLLIETVDAVIGVTGSERVGVRISPSSVFQDMTDSDPEALFGYVISELAKRDLAYLHLVEPGIIGNDDHTAAHRPADNIDSSWARKRYAGNLIATGGYVRDRAVHAVASGVVDAVGFGRDFIANPDLPTRLARNTHIAEAQRPTFFGGDNRGYLDYPSLAAEQHLLDLRSGRIEPTPNLGLDAETQHDLWHVAWANAQHAENRPVADPSASPH
ncbi:alkene reductase [Streptomyces sp. NPDC095817]|uniref:alkene reductase n=1 Tax=Streptomyces sp. NPDC095817 TaxID=3155082 RepID=UPI00332A4518